MESLCALLVQGDTAFFENLILLNMHNLSTKDQVVSEMRQLNAHLTSQLMWCHPSALLAICEGCHLFAVIIIQNAKKFIYLIYILQYEPGATPTVIPEIVFSQLCICHSTIQVLNDYLCILCEMHIISSTTHTLVDKYDITKYSAVPL